MMVWMEKDCSFSKSHVRNPTCFSVFASVARGCQSHLISFLFSLFLAHSLCNLNRAAQHQKVPSVYLMAGVRFQNPEDNNSMFLGLCVREEGD